MRMSYTVYRKLGEPNSAGEMDHASKHGRVGITISPLPSATLIEVHDLIDALQVVAKTLQPDSSFVRTGMVETVE